MIICIKEILEERISFNGIVKIIYVSKKYSKEAPTQKAKFNLYENQIYIANFKIFSNKCFGSAYKLSSSKSSLPFLLLFIYMMYLFILSILIQSQMIRHLGTQSAFDETQRALRDHLESTFKALQGTRRPLRNQDTRRASRHSSTYETQAFGHLDNLHNSALGHSGTYALEQSRPLGTKALGYVGTRALKVLIHSGTWAVEALYLVGSFPNLIFSVENQTECFIFLFLIVNKCTECFLFQCLSHVKAPEHEYIFQEIF